MRVVPATEVTAAHAEPPSGQILHSQWLEGPHNGDVLDVGIVTVAPGQQTPPHVHIGGQVIVVTAGAGFVETDGERVTIRPGDVVISAPGEAHVHGALPEGPFTHLTVTTGGYRFPESADRPS